MGPKDRLKIARMELKLTQEKFGSLLDLSQANIRDLESGKVKLSTLHSLAIENVFAVSASWLMTGNGEMFKRQPANKILEFSPIYNDQRNSDLLTKKINMMLAKMNEEQRKGILEYVGKEKLLSDLLEERKAGKAKLLINSDNVT
jgi:transcriptional regulator with XRE-family HTH domain